MSRPPSTNGGAGIGASSSSSSSSSVLRQSSAGRLTTNQTQPSSQPQPRLAQAPTRSSSAGSGINNLAIPNANARTPPSPSPQQSPRPNGPIESEDDVPLVAEVYENQRHYPMVGWSSTLLPTDPPSFSNEEGTAERNKNAFKVPPGWTWGTDWAVDITDKTDPEGWVYGQDLKHCINKAKGPKDSLRRRRLIRKRQPPMRIGVDAPKRVNNALTVGPGNPLNAMSRNALTVGPNRPPTKSGSTPSLAELYAQQAGSGAAAGSATASAYAAVALANSNTVNANMSKDSIMALNSLTIGAPSRNARSNYQPASLSSLHLAKKTINETVRVVEHQRWIPLLGWTDKLLPTDKRTPLMLVIPLEEGSTAISPPPTPNNKQQQQQHAFTDLKKQHTINTQHTGPLLQRLNRREDVTLEGDWKWNHDWKLVIDYDPSADDNDSSSNNNSGGTKPAKGDSSSSDKGTTDKDGWSYSVDFSKKFKWHSRKSIEHFVRRRVWIREKSQTVIATGAGASKSYSINVNGAPSTTRLNDMDKNRAIGALGSTTVVHKSKKKYLVFFERLDKLKNDLKAEEDQEDLVALNACNW